MKRYLVSCLLVIPSLVSAQWAVVDYQLSHKKQLVALAFEDKECTFYGYSHSMSRKERDALDQKNKLTFERACDAPLFQKKVIIHKKNKVMAFVMYYKQSEVEKVKSHISHAHGDNNNDAQSVKLACLCVAKKFRRKGCARALVHHMLQACQQWPEITTVHLLVIGDNHNAQKLYQSEGFVGDHRYADGVIRYTKQLSNARSE